MNFSWPDSDAVPPRIEENVAAGYIWILASPLMFCIGILGNSLSLVVFWRLGFGRSPTNVYLSCVATADNCVLLLGLLPQWLKQTGFFVLQELCPIACKVRYFCTFTSGDTARWLLAVFTVERAVAVRFPLRSFRATRGRSVLALCMCVLGCACVKNAHLFWTRGAVVDADTGKLKWNCGWTPGYKHFESFVRPWIAFSVVSVAPLVVILISNAVIVRVLIDRQRMNIIMTNAERKFRQTTFMCIAVSVAFFVCVTPNFALLIWRPYWKAAVSDRSALYVTSAVSNLMLYANHSINFFLYCLTGKVFRKELVDTFSGPPRKPCSSAEVDAANGGHNWARGQQHQLVAVVPVDSVAGRSDVEKCDTETVRQEPDLQQTTKL
ncbi:Galanin receptor type 2 [Lamellibrachia satsuma]|nr:Galanin receptor type 2 [Lamellibrachia satsuma]